MKQTIQLRLGQQLTMTPQLQQAIRLLQLSTLDLQLEVQNVLESNMMLEVDEEDDSSAALADTQDNPDEEFSTSGNMDNPEAEAPSSEQLSDSIPDELPLDSAWDDIYDGSTVYSRGEENTQSDEYMLRERGSDTLHEHLMWQLNLTSLSKTDHAIALAIIDAITDDGYLNTTIEELHQSLITEIEDDGQLDLDEVEAVLHRIQQFDPAGVGARNASECLIIQLRQFAPDTPWRNEAIEIVENHLELLGNNDLPQLMRRLKLSEQDLQGIIHLIQSLHPHPGELLAKAPPEYVIPDVIVTKHKGKWRVELNPATLPRIRVNQLYAGFIKHADDSEGNNALKNHLQEARWFLKSLQSRNETLLKVATCIVERQRGFLDYGEEAMKPLVLREVAETVEMHESTISRVTTQKYMHTPRGIFEFKFFFSSHVSTDSGGECSATAIRAIIKKLVAVENAAKPLSDSKLANLLQEQGINVARRTVAKYREAMSIAPSNERKRLA
jgi:RNA polymerase sigma-54 factor